MEVARWPVAPYGILSLRTSSPKVEISVIICPGLNMGFPKSSPKREISVIICLGLNMAFLHHSAFKAVSKSGDVQKKGYQHCV